MSRRRMADLDYEVEQLLIAEQFRLARALRRGATVCRWTGRRTQALVLAEAGRRAASVADGMRDADEAIVNGYDAALDDRALIAALATLGHDIYSDRLAAADDPAEPVPGPADTREVSPA